MLEDETIHFLRQSVRKEFVLQTTYSCIFLESEISSRSSECITMLYYVLYEPCLTTSHPLGILPCQMLIILPQYFDYNDNKYNNVADEDKGHRYNE